MVVSFEVQRQVVGARERSAARSTRERLVSGVFPEVTSQFVGSSEPPFTSFPRATKRPFSCAHDKRTVQIAI